MPVRTTEIIHIRAPIKGPLRHLDAQSKKLFPEILDGVVSELRDESFKLVHVSKCYRRGEVPCADNFWIKREVRRGIRATWFCRVTVVFQRGFRLEFDLDFWFEIPKILEALRADLYKSGYPYASGRRASEFARGEATRALEEVREEALSELKGEFRSRWGRHGVPRDVVARDPRKVCHWIKFEISSQPDLEKLREELAEVMEQARSLIDAKASEVRKTAREKFESLIPPALDPDSLEGLLALFLYTRRPDGAFEHQLRRFAYENSGRTRVSGRDIRDALLRLEVHGYASSRIVPRGAREELEKLGLGGFRRFYTTGSQRIPGRELLDRVGRKIRLGLHLEPLSRRRLAQELDAPAHLAGRAIGKLVRRRTLSEHPAYDSRGRGVKEIWSRRRRGELTKLEAEIVATTRSYYSRQRKLLSQMQSG